LGQRAARSILGEPPSAAATDAAPFFWSEHYDLKLRYVGHAPSFDATKVFGSLQARKAAVALIAQNEIKAVVSVGHDALSLACEAALEARDAARLDSLLSRA
jgi:3-phenylpropionate/trans-cinnamate dioxygenase ferredoxin reductase subunit